MLRSAHKLIKYRRVIWKHASFISLLIFTGTASKLGADEKKDASTNADTVEIVVVEGRSDDQAMRAFNAGDFKLAEVEFKKNAKCALRIERSQRALIDGVRNAQINQTAQSGALPQQPNSGPASSSNDIAPTSALGGGQANTEKVRKRSCDNRGFQLYMTGLSQIQLGKSEEAEKNFETAVFLKPNLYDAHYRLALMNLLKSETGKAEKYFDSLKKTLKRCHDCEAKNEILTRIDFLEKVFSGEVKLS